MFILLVRTDLLARRTALLCVHVTKGNGTSKEHSRRSGFSTVPKLTSGPVERRG